MEINVCASGAFSDDDKRRNDNRSLWTAVEGRSYADRRNWAGLFLVALR
jgi:hypothetical protein